MSLLMNAAVTLTIYYSSAKGQDLPAAYRKAAAASAFKYATVGDEKTAVSAETPLPMALGQPLEMKDAGKPATEDLDDFGRDMEPADVKALEATDSAFVIQCVATGSDGRRAAKAASELALALAKPVGGFIFDSDVRHVTPWRAWEKRVVNTWQGDVPVAKEQIAIAAREAGEGFRCVSLGMGKFGLPDLIVSQFSKSNYDGIGRVVNLVAQALIEGGEPAADGALTIASGANKATIKLVPGTKAEGDPENRLLEIVFPDQSATLVALFGATDEVRIVDRVAPDARVLAKLPELRKRFAAGLKGAHLLLKAPFANTHGGRELMWVEVTSWKDDAIGGLLQSDPVAVPSLKLGAKVQIQPADVLEWRLKQGDKLLESSH